MFQNVFNKKLFQLLFISVVFLQTTYGLAGDNLIVDDRFCFEDLPIEIRFHVCDYLNDHDVINASKALKGVREYALEKRGIPLKIDGDKATDFFEDFKNQKLPYIHNLTLIGNWVGKAQNEDFHTLFKIIDKVDNLFLEEITLDPLGASCLAFLMPRTLKSLSVFLKEDKFDRGSNDYYERRNKIEDNRKIITKNLCQMFPYSLKEFTWKNLLIIDRGRINHPIPSSIDSLNIKTDLGWMHANELAKFLYTLPALTSLTLEWGDGHFIDRIIEVGKSLPSSLKYFSMPNHNFDFSAEDLQKFVSVLPPNLQTLGISSVVQSKSTSQKKENILDLSALPSLKTLKLEGLSIAPHLQIKKANEDQGIQNVSLFSPLFKEIINREKAIEKNDLLALGWGDLNYLKECIIAARCPSIHPMTIYNLSILFFSEKRVSVISEHFIASAKLDILKDVISLMEIAREKEPQIPSEELGKMYFNRYAITQEQCRMFVADKNADKDLLRASDLGYIPAKNALAVFYMDSLKSLFMCQKEAVMRIQKAIDLLLSIPDKKKSSVILFNLGIAYLAIGDKENALPWLNKSAELEFQDAIEELKSLKEDSAKA